MELLQRWTKQSSVFNSESFKKKTSITGNTYNVGAADAGYDANRVGKTNWSCYSTKTLKQFLEKLKYTID